MASSTPADKLAATISKILEEYGEEIIEEVGEATEQVAKAGVKALRQASAAKFGAGPYSKSWTQRTEKDRTTTTGIIYSRMPGLPHLLEMGHMLRNGKRWPGVEHIAPVEEQLVEEFEKKIEEAVSK